ncbi:MAG: carboxylating nicotinate-nucleotide diphosphorylase [Chitinophagales bacterium]|nr:carboxylating nicotinate-nucleotide diphosphorylase [Bacteroidota bacterium]MCB9043749.1 carboxylating nicotinate-nucleotide diphosphorylase [Chitinophagales bacterium]
MNFDLNDFLQRAFAEDVGDGDYSSLACIPATAIGKARLLVKDTGILAGVELARQIFAYADEQLIFTPLLQDGAAVKFGDIAFIVEGSKQSILKTERLVLNLMQRMSGIATTTHRYVEAIQGTNAKLLDTRKTTPTLRYFEKWAVRIGGGYNHRFGLYDMIMLKDNHIDFAGGIRQAIEKSNAFLQENKLHIPIEIEVRNLSELQEVLACGKVQRIMLDNFTPEKICEVLPLIQRRYETEASGGITIDNIRAYAETGVDFISVGALTHSVKSLDLSLKAFN